MALYITYRYADVSGVLLRNCSFTRK